MCLCNIDIFFTDNALQTQMFPQEMTDIMNIDASENNKSLVQYLTDLQMQNQLTVYIQNVSVKMMREKIGTSIIIHFLIVLLCCLSSWENRINNG